jgi:hypothetical protein
VGSQEAEDLLGPQILCVGGERVQRQPVDERV